MRSIRRSVRAVAFAWLLCQVASLSAFVPEICCVSHAAEAEAKEAKEDAAACHETPAPAPKVGDACPMHHGSQSQDEGTTPHDCCVMTNACEGPGTHLASLFAFIGFPETPASSFVVLDSIAAWVAAPSPLLYQLSTPDAPPPKA